jgi:hypothetical protein
MENSEYRNKEIEAFLESEYVNIQEGESRVLEFLKNKEKVVKKPDFNGNPIEKVQYIVIDPEDPERTERKFELTRKHVRKIYNELRKGSFVLEVFRTGRLNQTEYHVKVIR